MSDNYTYARPYAEAAFKTALDDNSLKDWKECLVIISEIVSDMNVKAILANPKVTNAKRMEFLESFLPDLLFQSVGMSKPYIELYHFF